MMRRRIRDLLLLMAALSWSSQGPARAEDTPRDLYIQIRPVLAGFDPARLDSVVVFCHVGATAPGPNGFSDSLGSGYATVLGSSRGQSDNHLQAVVTMAILPRFHVSAWGGPKPSMSDARYYHCYIVYKCRGTTEAPRAVEPGDALLADPATACLGFDAKRSQFTVSGAIPQDWD